MTHRHTPHVPTGELLDRYLTAVRPALPLRAVWAHGSLGAGDYQPGRSDLDLVAVLERPCTRDEEGRVGQIHARLAETDRLAVQLHCSYMVSGELQDPRRDHLRWAHEELKHRPVTPVTRRELHDVGLVLFGEPPVSVLPAVTDEQLTDFVAEDLADFWRPAVDVPEHWLRNIWVDLGLLTLARARVTLRTGRLITKAEALDVLAELDAPAEVVADIRRRRYGDPERRAPVSASDMWLRRRAQSARDFLGPAIERTVAEYAAQRGGPPPVAARRESADPPREPSAPPM